MFSKNWAWFTGQVVVPYPVTPYVGQSKEEASGFFEHTVILGRWLAY